MISDVLWLDFLLQDYLTAATALFFFSCTYGKYGLRSISDLGCIIKLVYRLGLHAEDEGGTLVVALRAHPKLAFALLSNAFHDVEAETDAVPFLVHWSIRIALTNF